MTIISKKLAIKSLEMKSSIVLFTFLTIHLAVSLQTHSTGNDVSQVKAFTSLKFELIRSILNDKEYLSLKPNQQTSINLILNRMIENYLKAKRQKTRF